MTEGKIWPFWKEEKFDGLRAWYGYINKFQLNSEAILRNHPETQRKCKCHVCGVEIPREIPRIFHSLSFAQSHLCPKCGKVRIAEKRGEIEEVKKDLEKAIENCRVLEEALQTIMDNELYSERMAVRHLAKELEK